MASVLTREACLMHRERLVAISRSQPQRERDPGTGSEGSERSRAWVGLGSETRLLCIEQSGRTAQFPRPAARTAPRRRDGVALKTCSGRGIHNLRRS